MRKRIILLMAACVMMTGAAAYANEGAAQTEESAYAAQETVESGESAYTAENADQPETSADVAVDVTQIFAAGAGTEAEPYQIESVDQLLAFRDSVNDGSIGGYAGSCIELAADLSLEGVEWEPIGNMNDMETYSTIFMGTFDGAGHTISGLNYGSDEFICGAGLFGVSYGTVENLTVEDAVVTVTDGESLAIGDVVGYNGGFVGNVKLTGASSVTGNNCTGGLVGGNNGSVLDCTVEGVTVTVIGDNDFSEGLVQCDIAECGGLLIGGGFGGTVDGCTASGTVKAEGNEPVGLGGIGGCLEMMDSITNCTADVVIESQNGGHAIGGLCGYAGTHSDPDICLNTEGFSTTNYPSIIDNCSVNVTIHADGATHVGGLVGTGLYYYGEETAYKITNCKVSGEIDGAVTPGAVAGRAEGSIIESCDTDILIDGEKAENEVGTTDRMYESADQ